jgi:hypothetical protein
VYLSFHLITLSEVFSFTAAWSPKNEEGECPVVPKMPSETAPLQTAWNALPIRNLAQTLSLEIAASVDH